MILRTEPANARPAFKVVNCEAPVSSIWASGAPYVLLQ